MHNSNSWNWEIGKKVVADIGEVKRKFEYMEEPYASPDGEKVAAIIKNEEAEFGVCVNENLWENTFDKIWYLRFGPDNRLTALASSMAEWTVAVDDAPWENKYEFVWDTRFSPDGQNIIVAAKQEMKYLAVINDTPWENSFQNLTHLTTSADGKRVAAVVQVENFSEADINKFQEGCFSVAVDGKAWDAKFVNVWELSFSSDGQHVAAEVRSSLYDYTIVVDGVPWEQTYPSVWKPVFNPADGTLTAPVKSAGSWTIAQDGKPIWDRGFVQLWQHAYSSDGKGIAAIVCPQFGRWTVAVNAVPWGLTFGDLVSDMCISPDGKRVACLGKEGDQYSVVVDGKTWNEKFEMAWRPVFSPDSRHVAAKVEKNGRYTICVDGKPMQADFAQVWEPIFSPDGEKILVRAIEGASEQEKYIRQVLSLADVIG